MAFRVTATAAAAATPRLPSALRCLARDGVEALKPQLVLSKYPDPPTLIRGGIPGTAQSSPKLLQESEDDLRRSWHKPKVSRRKAHVLRKAAIRDGTYGSFDPQLGGWDPAWDEEFLLKSASEQGRFRLTVPKKTSRQRNREQRAQKIEKNMEGMDQRIEEYYAAKHAAKPPDTFENRYKKLMKNQR